MKYILFIICLYSFAGYLCYELANMLLEQAITNALEPTYIRDPHTPDVSHCVVGENVWDCIRNGEHGGD